MLKKICFFGLIICTSWSWGQMTQEKLEEKKAQLQAQIRENEKLLQNVKKQEKTVLTIINLKNQKIKLKEELIRTNELQAQLLNKNMHKNQVKIQQLQGDLELLKKDYAAMIVKSYKSRSEQSRAMFLLSSESFLQAYKRAQYMKQYASFRKIQGEEIVQKSKELNGFNKKLTVQKTVKQKLIKENLDEKLVLEQEKQEQLKLANSIKKDKKKLAAEIKQKQRESKAIDRQIDKLIRDAIAEANRKAAARAAKANPKKVVTPAASKATESSTKIVLTSEGKIESDNFKNSKGKLPWPVEHGTVSLRFGDQRHPEYPSLTIHNSGVEISTEPGANARAVFAGEVTQVQVVSPVNKAVIIKHGDFFTVYQNLKTVNVREGDKVFIKQNLGQIRTNGDTGKTIIKFMISQNTTYANPANWIHGM
ncbi:peptidoglycan DD-metalloendopeptidase family protein [Flavobacterium branchiophilum]|uniref:Probable M23/M37 family peptidase n=1 Tax=Flavobacterium branchiophilum (strain FL-15) TaxID=1034807 RepID=G2Z363_FLABF|nr:peptidoglycan DD-metalloendopeptidase family protein [Flavobacterium branchiophilum]CCB68176.1 Probable M23/M37 family peptidase precursor [Flavobacterium branchiophilum FL-15]